MASFQRRPDAVYEEFQPKLELTETPEAHFLIIHLPGFTRDQVKIRYVSSTKAMSVSGERPEGGNKWIRFNDAYPVPENCEINKLRGKFDQGILTITMPKKFITPVVPKEELRTSEDTTPKYTITSVKEPRDEKSDSLSSAIKDQEEISQDPSLGAVYEEFQPKAEMIENLEAYLLQVYLPGFTKEQVKIKYVSSSRVMSISGERPIGKGDRWIRFEQAYPVPENFYEERLGAKFDQGILTITMPKKFISKVAPKEEVKTTQERVPSPLQKYVADEPKPEKAQVVLPPKYTTPSLEEPRDHKKSASLPSFLKGLADTQQLSTQAKPQKGQEELVPKPTILKASIEGKRIEDIVDIIGKGIQEVSASASNAVTNIGDGTLNDEEKHLLALVIAALGAYVSYRLTASGKP